MIACDEELRSHATVQQIEGALCKCSEFEFSANRPLLESIAASSLARDAVRLALRKARENHDYQLPKFVMDANIKGWTFLVTDFFALSIGIRSVPATLMTLELSADERAALPKIQPYPFDIFLSLLQADGLEITHYGVVADTDVDSPRLEFHSQDVMHTGATMLLRGGTDVTISKLRGTLIYLEITGSSKCHVLPQFDPITREFSSWISGDPMASRLELLTRTVAEFGHVDAVPHIQTLTQHRDHYVRWNSIRHLLRLDLQAGKACVQTARNDPHHDVRDAAERTLGLLESLESTG